MATTDEQLVTAEGLAGALGTVGAVLNATSASGSAQGSFMTDDSKNLLLTFTSPSADGFTVSGYNLTCQTPGIWRVKCQFQNVIDDPNYRYYTITPRIYIAGVGYVMSDAGFDTTVTLQSGKVVQVRMDVVRDGNGSGSVKSTATVTLERVK